MTKRKMGKRIKQIMSAMLAGVVCASLLNLPGMTIEADAEEPAISAPSAETYKEVGDLQQYDKLHFGYDDWYYVGTDGNGLVLVNFYVNNKNFFAAPPSGQRYMEDSSALLDYEDSALDISLSNHINNFSEEQKEMILPVNINLPENNLSPKTGGSRQIERYIYVPNVVWKDNETIEADEIDVGSASQSILSNIGKLKPENVDLYYWLRDGDKYNNPYISDGNTIKNQGRSLSKYDGRNIDVMSVLHHDKTKVAFVSSINEYGFWDNTAMTIRYNGEGQIKSNAVFSKDGVKISNPNYGEFLVVQWKEGNEDKVVRKLIDFNTTFISASELGLLSGLTADCKVWVEHYDANAGLIYAKKATYVNSNIVSFDMGVFRGQYSIKDQILFEGDKVVKNTNYYVGYYYQIDDTNWRFDGWFTDLSYNTPYDFDSPVTSDITIYSKWTKMNGVVGSIYYENDGHYIYGYAPFYWSVADNIIFSRPQGPQEDGYTFAGWFTDDSFNEEFDFDTPITADTVICAKMDRIPGKYILSFEDDTNWNYYPLVFNEGDKCVEPDMSQFVVPGYTFEGWYILGTDTKFDFNTPITEDIRLEARWTPDENPGGDPDPNPNPGPGGDPDPSPNPGPDGDPDPNPNPGPGGNPNPNPNPGPGGDPNPNPNPGPDGDPDVPSAPDYLDKLYGSLNNLKKSGFTGTYIWTEGTSLPFEIIKMMRDADFTLEFRYSYEGVDYVVKINKYNAPKEDLDWYGPCYLAGLNSKVGTLSGNVYTVAEGESLSSIAARFNTTVEDIMAKNPEITDADYIYVGQKINL